MSDEKFDSYLWTLQQFHVISKLVALDCYFLPLNCLQESTMIDPKVVFTDGDTELAKSLHNVLPNSVHLLCRYHIAQNFTRALAGTLRGRLSEFLNDFWRVSSIEDLQGYTVEWSRIQTNLKKHLTIGHYSKTRTKSGLSLIHIVTLWLGFPQRKDKNKSMA